MPWLPVRAAPDSPVLPFSPALWTVFANIFPDVFQHDPASGRPALSVLGMLAGGDTSQLMQRALSVITYRGQYRQRFMLPMNGAASASAGEVGSYTQNSRDDWAQAKVRAAADLVSVFGWPIELDKPIDLRSDLVDDLPLRILLHLARLAGHRVSADLWVSDVEGNSTLTRIERARSDQYLPLRMRSPPNGDDIDIFDLDSESADGAATIAGPDEPVEWLIFGRTAAPDSPLFMYYQPPERSPDQVMLSALSSAQRADAYASPRADGDTSFVLPTHPITGLPVSRAGQGYTRIREVVDAPPMRYLISVPARSADGGSVVQETVGIDVQALFAACDAAWAATGRGPPSSSAPRAGLETLQQQLQEMLENGGQSSARVEMNAAEARRYAQGILLAARVLQDNMTSEGWRDLHRVEETGFRPHFPVIDDPNTSIEAQAVTYGQYFWDAIANTSYPAEETFLFLCSLASSWGNFALPIRYQLVHANWFTNLLPELDSHLNAPDLPGAFQPHSLVWIRALRLQDQSTVWSIPLIFSRYNMHDAKQWLLEFSKTVRDQPSAAIRVHLLERRRGAAPAKPALKRRMYQRRTGALRIVPSGPASAMGGGGVTGPAAGPPPGLPSPSSSSSSSSSSTSLFPPSSTSTSRTRRRQSAAAASSSSSSAVRSPFAPRSRRSRSVRAAALAGPPAEGGGAIVSLAEQAGAVA